MTKEQAYQKIYDRRLTTEKLAAMKPEERKKAILLERLKCAQSLRYLIETYFTVDAGGKILPFVLFKYQREVLEDYIKFPNNITMKTRQMGFTTFTAAFIACMVVNTNNFKTLIISKEMISAKKFLKTIKDVLDAARDMTRISGPDSPSWLIPEYLEGYNNKESFHLTNKSLVEVQGNTEDSGRGFSALNLAVVDEVAAIDSRVPGRMDEIWGALGPALSTVRGRTIMISCVTKDTFVFTDKGIQQIGDFIQNDDGTVKGYEVPEYNILGHDGFRKGNLFKNNGFGKTYKIETRYTELEAHEDHKIWAYSEGRYDIFKVKDLKNGDWLNVKRGMEVWGNNDDVSNFDPITFKTSNIFIPQKITEDIGYFIGLYIAEGCMTIKNDGGWIDITCGDKEITEVFNRMKLRWTTNDNLHFRICSKNLIQFMQYLGFKQEKANFKEIPSRLLQCSRKVLIALLQGLFDGDGGINIKNGLNRVAYTSTSEKLINQIRIILANTGILCGKYMWPKKNDKPRLDKTGCMIKANFDRYTLELTGVFSDMFVDNVGFRLERKKKIFGKRTTKPFLFEIPNDNEIIDKLYEEGFTGQGLRRNHGVRIDNKVITSNTVNKIFELLPDDNFKNKAKEEFLFDDSSCWVPIESMIESENYTYDVSLPDIEDDKWCHSVTHSLLMSYNTPKGSTGWYYDTYTNNKKMGFNIIDAHWTEHPMFSMGRYSWVTDKTNPNGGYIKYYDETWPETLYDKESGVYIKVDKETYSYVRDGRIRSPWYDFESSKLGPRKTACELDCSFVGTGGEVLGPEILRDIKSHAGSCKYSLINSKNGLMKDYYEFVAPKPGHNYIVSSDVMTGDGSDYSTITILDLDTLEICGTYMGQPLPSALAVIVAELGYRFNNAWVLVENAGGGGTTLQDLKVMAYPKIYYSILKKKDESSGMKKRKIGLWVAEDTRDKGGDKLEEYIRNNKIKIPDLRYSDEFYNWIWDKDGKRRHAPGRHDDMIMSLQWAIYFHAYVYKRNLRNRDNFSSIFNIQRTGTFQGVALQQEEEFNPYYAKKNNGRDIIDQKRNFYKEEEEESMNGQNGKRRGGLFL